ncbi:tRNA glutamyl-Q(34) synthetase GluQRS [Kamptonema cortianum]|nr:tRNA glutamyl-Q(34) synthetase GluQRS [Geitlerinema splendidum]MDK3155205.1 tRNA glutamyl-Q(34) synthetase GluQRS [Kamptonema cortianum]
MSNTRVLRFAPSPTGFLHIGHAYSFEFTHRLAGGGSIKLRVEDIDPARSRIEFVEAMLEDMAWLGLPWEPSPLFQSERMPVYKEALQELIDRELVYPCFCSRKEILAEISEAGGAPHGPVGLSYPGTCRNLSADEIQTRKESYSDYSYRLNLESCKKQLGVLAWHDRFSGKHSVEYSALSDPVLARRDTPTSYHLSVVIDDAYQQIDLVTRGHEIMPSTNVHRILQASLNLPTPEYAHHAMVLGDDGRPFAKRNGAQPVRELRQKGFTPAQILDLAIRRLDDSSRHWCHA